jgi:hypothetical protein
METRKSCYPEPPRVYTDSLENLDRWYDDVEPTP